MAGKSLVSGFLSQKTRWKVVNQKGSDLRMEPENASEKVGQLNGFQVITADEERDGWVHVCAPMFGELIYVPCIRICMCVRGYVRVYIYICTDTDTHTLVHAHSYTKEENAIYPTCIHAHSYTNYIYIYAHTHLHTRAYTHIRIPSTLIYYCLRECDTDLSLHKKRETQNARQN